MLFTTLSFALDKTGERRWAPAALTTDVLLFCAGAVGITGYLVIKNEQENNQINKIEENIKLQSGFSNFSMNAISADSNNENLVEIFGVAQTSENSDPQFSSVVYKINEKLYNEILNNVKVEYKVYPDGEISAKNTHSSLKNANEYIDILKQLVEVTNQEIVEKNFFTSTDLMNNAIAPTTKNAFAVTGIGKVSANLNTNLVHFTIDVVDVNEKDGSLAKKQLLVSQELTEEIKNNPFKAYESYVKNYNNPQKCDVQELKKEKSVLYKNKNNKGFYSFVLDGEDPLAPQRF